MKLYAKDLKHIYIYTVVNCLVYSYLCFRMKHIQMSFILLFFLCETTICQYRRQDSSPKMTALFERIPNRVSKITVSDTDSGLKRVLSFLLPRKRQNYGRREVVRAIVIKNHQMVNRLRNVLRTCKL